MNLNDLARLGKELMRLRWTKEADLARADWYAVRGGGRATDTVIRIAGALGFGPKKLEHTFKCRQCTRPTNASVVLNLPDRHVFRCEACSWEWVSMVRMFRSSSLSLRRAG